MAVMAIVPYIGRGESAAGTRVGVWDMTPSRYVADEHYDHPNACRRGLSFLLIATAAACGATSMSPYFDGQRLKQTPYRGHEVVAGGGISRST